MNAAPRVLPVHSRTYATTVGPGRPPGVYGNPPGRARMGDPNRAPAHPSWLKRTYSSSFAKAAPEASASLAAATPVARSVATSAR